MNNSGDYQSVVEHGGWFDLSGHGKIEATGADAAVFLHNLSTNDITKLAVGSGCEAFFANVKAKVVSHALVFRLPAASADVQRFALDVVPGLADKTVQHLDHFLISEQVEIVDRTHEFAQIHMAGPDLPKVVSDMVGLSWPEQPYSVHVVERDGLELQVRRVHRLGMPGMDFLVPAEKREFLEKQLNKHGIPSMKLDLFETFRVEAGMPVHGIDIDETNLVPETGRLARAVSYTKGCYLGQEPIVRARDLGHVNWSLMGLACRDSVRAGCQVVRDGQPIGRVTSAVCSPRHGFIALAYLRRGSDQPGTSVQVALEEGLVDAQVAALPFAKRD